MTPCGNGMASNKNLRAHMMTHVSFDVKNPLAIFFVPHIGPKGILEILKPHFPS